MIYTDDPVRDFERHDARQQARIDKLPKCYECGYPIQGERCFEFNGEIICESCLDLNHKKWTEDYIE